jgi:hypothetical protein
MKANSFVLTFILSVSIVANTGLFAQNQTDKEVAQYYNYQTLLKQLLTEPPTSGYSDASYVYWQTVTKAESALALMGEEILPDLISEMNKPEFISDENGYVDGNPFAALRDRLADPKWIKRMALARVIERISKQDFMIRSGPMALIDDPDKPFKLINDWWKTRKP